MAAGAVYASVAVPVPVRRLFTYRVEDGLERQIEIGARVRVPFGPRKVVGTVVEWPAAAPEEDVATRAIDDRCKFPRSVIGIRCSATNRRLDAA